MNTITSKKLAFLKTRMTEAHETGEWQRLAELDRECQLTIKQIIADDPRAMFEELREMLGFYANIIKQCEQQRDGFANEVKQIRQNKKGKNMYRNLQYVQ